MITKDRNYRSFQMDAQDDYIIEGYAIVWNVETVMYTERGIEYKEQIVRGALDGADLSDVVLNVDHQGRPLARTKNGTLHLTIDDKGLFIRAELRTDEGKKVYDEIKQGLFETMSFCFQISEEEYNQDYTMRSITKINKLWDVSVTTRGAYEQTSVFARAYFEDKAAADRQELELAKKKYKYMTL